MYVNVNNIPSSYLRLTLHLGCDPILPVIHIPPSNHREVWVELHPCAEDHRLLGKHAVPEECNDPLLPHAPYHPFPSIEEFEFADVVICESLSIKSIDCLLAACRGSKITFANHSMLFDKIDAAAQAGIMVRNSCFCCYMTCF